MENDLGKTRQIDSRELRAGTGRSDAAHFLSIIAGSSAGTLVEISGRPLTVGRDPGADIRLQDPGVSGKHCSLLLIEGSLIVEDLKSTNGVFIGDERIKRAAIAPVGSVLGIGLARLVHEVRDRAEARRVVEVDDELREAAQYVLALLPRPIEQGPVRVEWRFVPSTRLSGDAFGYRWLDTTSLAVYLLDVSGHGAAAALHTATVLNTLRVSGALAADPHEPGAVLAAVNDRFQMDQHGDKFLTMWYGVLDVPSGTLRHANAGHPPVILRQGADGPVEDIGDGGVGIGILPHETYPVTTTHLAPGYSVYVFSDGVYEIELPDGSLWSRQGFRDLVGAPPTPGLPEALRIERGVRAIMSGTRFDDDFTLIVLQIPG